PSFSDDLDTIDLDVQHRFSPAVDHELTWGLNYRLMSNRNQGKGVFALEPSFSRDQLISSFVQDQITWRDAGQITIGTKLEHNDFSGFEIQPGVRTAWSVAEGQSIWAAVSRAVR